MSFDIKQFFRFVISGYFCIIYWFLMLFFLTTAFHSFVLRLISAQGVASGLLIDAAVSSLVLSAPLGFLVHEVGISMFSPYRHSRFLRFLVPRHSIEVLGQLVPRMARRDFTEEYLQAVLEYAKCRGDKERDGHLVKELSNRYSYYYGRVDVGVYAPLFALGLSGMTSVMFGLTVIWMNVYLVLAPVLLISSLLLIYVPKLLREIDAIETLIVSTKREEIIRAIRLVRRSVP